MKWYFKSNKHLLYRGKLNMVFMLWYMLHVKDIFSFVSEHSETNLWRNLFLPQKGSIRKGYLKEALYFQFCQSDFTFWSRGKAMWNNVATALWKAASWWSTELSSRELKYREPRNWSKHRVLHTCESLSCTYNLFHGYSFRFHHGKETGKSPPSQ